MGTVNEQIKWEEEIYLLERKDPVEGGANGVSNRQAKSLANRTRYLKAQIDSFQDAKEFTFYKTQSDPDGTKAGLAGTAAGKLFRVAQGTDSFISFIYYLNDAGKAVAVAKSNAAGSAVAFSSAKELLAFVPTTSSALAMDISNGEFYFWRDNAWGKAPSDVKVLRDQILKNLVGLHALSASVAELAPLSDMVTGITQQLAWMGPLLSGQIQMLQLANTTLAEAMCALSDEAADRVNAVNVTLGSQLQRLEVAVTVLAQTMNDVVGESDYQDFKMKTLMSLHQLSTAMAPFEGFDPANVATKDASTVSQEMMKEQYAFGEPGRIIRINLTTPSVPPNKEAGLINSSVTMDIDGSVFACYSTIEVQGASSAGYAKKNLNIAFYADEARKESLELKIGEVMPHDEWTFKANWIDHTHCRNLMSYRLWVEMMDSRGTWPMRDVEHAYAGKTGAGAIPNGATGVPLGYPCIMYVNGEFYGVGSLMTGKKRPNYNIAKNKPLEIWMGFDNWTPITNIDLNNVSLKAPSAPTEETYAAIDAFGAFARSPLAEFSAAAETRLDKNNAMDFYILSDFLIVQDLIGGDNAKNFIMITRDGIKWFLMPYDLDTVFGLEWNGKSIAWGTEYKYMTGSFWSKLYSTFKGDINSRYAYLRRTGVLSVGNIYQHIHNITSKYTEDMFDAEFSKWPGLPSLPVTSVDQLLDWTKKRLAYLDSKYSYSA